ncbi:MAG: insulinase family protein [Alistipes sp.]|nr:insulinase family protein [Alistipes sp.]
MRRILFAVVAFVMGATMAQAQINPQQPIPADKEIRQGVLPNGLTYYIRHNEKPKGMANFYIVHDVGAVQEGDNQQGLAHFLEHMAFNGTKNYPKKTLIEYLEKIGVKFGANLNAFTSWDLTQYYMTDVPVARETVVDSTLLILHDWSHFISLLPEEIDAERGVISEELRGRDNASWRSTVKMLQAVGKGTIYAERNLIGYLDGLKSFTYDDLREFYHKWYRPDYQTVVVVGDIDVDKVEQKIKSMMADIPAAPANAAQKEVVTIPQNDEPIVSINADPEMQQSNLMLFYKSQAMPKQYRGLVAAEIADYIKSFASVMIRERLNDISRKPDAPFISAGVSIGGNMGICPTLDTSFGQVMTQDGKLMEGYKALLTEMERMRRYGFTEGEFERAKQMMMSRIESHYNSRGDREHDYYAEACISNFREGTAIPDAETEYQLSKQIVEMIPLQAVNQAVKQSYDPLKNCVIVVNSPKKDGVAVPTEAELVGALKAAVAAEVEPFKDNVVKEPLISDESALKGSPVKKANVNEALGTTEWTLKNGIKVVVKQTPYEADNITVTATSWGGLALMNDEEYYSARMMPVVMNMSGISKFSATDLRKQLSGKQAQAAASVSDYKHTVTGTSTLKDVETMMQLFYLQFTAPRFDKDGYDTFMKRYQSALANQMTNPDMIFSITKTATVYGNNYRRQQLTPELLEKVKLEQMAAIHQRLYSNAADFRFTFVGNMSAEELKPLVEKYIGSLPAAKSKSKMVDDNVRYVRGGIDKEFTAKMEQPKVSVYFSFIGDTKAGIKDRMTMTYLTQALRNRYTQSIREEKGGTYGVSVSGGIYTEPKEEYLVQMQFDTNEQMADELADIIVAEVKKIATEGPLAEDMEKSREYLLKDYKKSLEMNDWWWTVLTRYYDYKLDYTKDYEPMITAVTADDVKAMAARMINDKNMIKIVMRPEK